MGQGRHGYVQQTASVETPDGGDELAVLRISGNPARDLYAKFSDGTEKQFTGSGSGPIFTANNGLTKTGANVALGGALVADTSIDLAGFELAFSGGTIIQRTSTGFNEISGAGTYFSYVPDKSTIVNGVASGSELDLIPSFSYIGGSDNSNFENSANMFIGGSSNDGLSLPHSNSIIMGQFNDNFGAHSYTYHNGNTNTVTALPAYCLIHAASSTLGGTDISFCDISGDSITTAAGSIYATSLIYGSVHNIAGGLSNSYINGSLVSITGGATSSVITGAAHELDTPASCFVAGNANIFNAGAGSRTNNYVNGANNEVTGTLQYSVITGIANTTTGSESYLFVAGQNNTLNDTNRSLILGQSISIGTSASCSIIMTENAHTLTHFRYSIGIGELINTATSDSESRLNVIMGLTSTLNGLIQKFVAIGDATAVNASSKSIMIGDGHSSITSSGNIIAGAGGGGSVITATTVTNSLLIGSDLGIQNIVNGVVIGSKGVDINGAGVEGASVVGVGGAKFTTLYPTGTLPVAAYTTYFENLESAGAGGTIKLYSPDTTDNLTFSVDNNGNFINNLGTIPTITAVTAEALVNDTTLTIKVGANTYKINATLVP